MSKEITQSVVKDENGNVIGHPLSETKNFKKFSKEKQEKFLKFHNLKHVNIDPNSSTVNS